MSCPICFEEHVYPLLVRRMPLNGNAPHPARINGEPLFKQFRRTFFCPTRDEHFDSTIRLIEPVGELIHDVGVGEPA